MRGDRGRVWPAAQRSGHTLPQQAGANADGCLLDARKALRVGAEKMSMALSSSAAQKRLDILEGGGLQCLEESRPGMTTA